MNWEPFLWTALSMAFIIACYMVGPLRRMMTPPSSRKRSDEAKAILENRYALGEIDEEEFTHRTEVLRRQRGHSHGSAADRVEGK